MVIALLTVALLWINHQYVEVSEALQKPFVTVRSDPRDDEAAIMDAPYVTQVARTDTVHLSNVGTGPALELSYGFRQVDAQPGVPAIHHTGRVNYLAAEHEWPTHLGRNLLPNRTFEFYANYQSLSGKTYKAKLTIENKVIKS